MDDQFIDSAINLDAGNEPPPPDLAQDYADLAAGRIDYRQPDYAQIIRVRLDRLRRIQEDSSGLVVVKLKEYYAGNPADFIDDWGVTFDPRRLARNQSPIIPMILWPRQREYLDWLTERWEAGERGLVEKARDCGVTWLSVSWAVAQWLHRGGLAVGFGSRKLDLVDNKDDPNCIFEKARFFIRNLPKVFLPIGFTLKQHCPYRRIINPENFSTIVGEGGDEIGRGGRASIYFVDEAAFVEHQETVDSALSQTTECQIDISTPNGPGNPFARKRLKFNGTDRIFIFDWRDDPRKDMAWYNRQVEEQDEVTVAQEIDRDYNASAEDAFIPAKWVAAAIDAHETLDFDPIGIRATGFDPSDVGDHRGIACRHGSILLECKLKKTGDITHAIPWAFETADEYRADVLSYDADGMGAPVMKVALQQRSAGRMKVIPYHGSSGVIHPNQEYGSSHKTMKKVKSLDKRTESLHDGVTLRKNIDRFVNFRAQSWTWVRDRFEATYAAVNKAREGKLVNVNPEHLISISSKCAELKQLQAELSMPKRMFSSNGKIKVESKEEMRRRGISSPNCADSIVIAFSVEGGILSRPKSKPLKLRQRVILDQAVGY